MVSSAPRRYRCRRGFGIRGGCSWRCTSQRLYTSLEPPRRTSNSSLSAASGSLGANSRPGRQPTCITASETAHGTLSSLRAILPSHSLALHARDMPLLCYLSDPLGCLAQTAYPSRCCMCSWRLIQYPLPLRNCLSGAFGQIRACQLLGPSLSYRRTYAARVFGLEDEDVRDVFHRTVRGRGHAKPG